MPGALAIERIQAGLEATRFTAVPATRRVYGEYSKAWYEEVLTREQLKESLTSYVTTYRGVVTDKYVKAAIPGYVTAADLAWWGQLAWKGNVAGVLSAATVYTYTFTPTIAADDLKTATLEFYSDTQGHQVPGCFADKFEISWQKGKAVTFTADLVGQQDNAQAVTAAIGDRTGLNPVAGTTAKVYIDTAGGTMGATQALNVLGGKMTWVNNVKLVTHNLGNLYPDDAYREPRLASVELDIHYNTETERVAFDAGTERLVRVAFTGPVIAGSTGNVPESVTADFWGYWKSAPFATSDAMRTLKLTADTQYDTTAGFDWRVAVANALPTLP